MTPGENDPMLLRDRFMPELGISNVGKRAQVLPRFNGTGFVWYGIQVFHGDNVQFWVSLDRTN